MKRLVSLALGVVLAVLIASASGGAPTAAAQGGVSELATTPLFYVRSYGGKCLDFGPPPQAAGAPVFIFDCNGTIAQQVRIEEVNDRHDVILRAGSKVIGVKQGWTNASKDQDAQAPEAAATETPLELQNEANRTTVFSLGQVFALDGDSILLASNHNLVVKVQNARGKNRAPLVLGARQLADAEFWTVSASDGSAARPTSGFVRVPADRDHRSLADQLVNAVQNAKWGTVIELDPNVSIDLTNVPPLQLPAGVTLRGNRRGTLLGPELTELQGPGRDHREESMLTVAGDQVRITGLRLRGPTRGLHEDVPLYDGTVRIASGILAPDRFVTIIDHNDMSDWTNGAVQVEGENDSATCLAPNEFRVSLVRVARNFLHHNQRWGLGYGVVVGTGGYPLIQGNTFDFNRHAIAADGLALTGYTAEYNLVLSGSPDYSDHGFQQDFDMHGSDPSSHHTGGIAGSAVNITHNTFLGSNRLNYDLRGVPCETDHFTANISEQNLPSAIRWYDHGHQFHVSPTTLPPAWLDLSGNHFDSADPTKRLGVGDFDGDGVQDLFLATGTAWYYAPGGKAEWRYLNAQTDRLDTLLFGDFDGDGRTDVFTQHGFNWDVSWGGASAWEKINVFSQRLGDYAIGDFVGDNRDDVFYADGQHWYVSDGGTAPFTLVNDSSYRIPALRFGDFNADGKTDVFAVANGQWSVSYSGSSGWQRLRSKLTDSAENLTVADFNGDGRADVATVEVVLPLSWRFKVSYSGTSGWTSLRTFSLGQTTAGIGRFDGNASADVLLWHDDYLDISTGGAGALTRHSRQDMR
ncbi:MAG: VCBS repeat-containing protein [Anaerolineae bacterium]|nr:VCBS repeat-containing protein [Anaerolineae bacterium]